jgi:histidine transporter
VPLWPVGPALAIAFMVFVVTMLGWFEETRVALYAGLAWLVWLAAIYRQRNGWSAARRRRGAG